MRFAEIMESRLGYVYHGTDINSAFRIVKEGEIVGGKHYDHHPYGVSLTRDYTVALNFGRAWERQFPVVFVFDQEAIVRSPLKLFPRRDTSSPGEYRDRMEAEEMVLGDLPLEPYLVSINIPKEEIARALGAAGKQYRQYLDSEGWEGQVSPQRWNAGVRKLLNHPKLNRVVPRIDGVWRRKLATDDGYWQLDDEPPQS